MPVQTTPHQSDKDDGRFQLAMVSSGIGMAIVDLQGCWLEVNPAFERMFGFSAADVIGRAASEFAHPDDVQRSRIHLQGMIDGSQTGADAESRYLRRDGSIVWAQANVGVMRDNAGQPQSLIVQLRDVTAQHAALDALRERNRLLEQRVHDQGTGLDAANRQLELLTFGISHDLRAPLRAIDSFANLLGKHASDRLQPTDNEYLHRIRAAAERMASLIDGLVELSRVGKAELKPACVDVSLLAEWAVAELQEQEPSRRANIVIAPGLMVHGDERLLKTLLVQLLRNAWKFSRDREEVCIRVEGARTDGGLQLSIRDQGRGIDMRYADKLFQPFQRLHGEDHGAGHGLGLAVAQRIAQRHGGQVWAESEVGVGSVFHVQLPDASGPQASTVDTSLRDAAANGSQP